MGLSIGDFPLMQRMSSLRRARHLQLRECMETSRRVMCYPYVDYFVFQH